MQFSMLRSLSLILFLCFFNQLNIGFAQVQYDVDTLKNNAILEGIQHSPAIFHIADQTEWDSTSGINFLPLSIHNRYNVGRPISANDGALASHAGFQTVLQGGIKVKWRSLAVQAYPQIHGVFPSTYPVSPQWGNAKDRQSTRLRWQGTQVKYGWGPLAIRVAESNFIWGATNINHLLMGVNAPGFTHAGLSTRKPINVGVGLLEFDLVAGQLDAGPAGTPNENYNLQLLPARYDRVRTRYYNGMTFSIVPHFLKNSRFGLIRQYQLPMSELKNIDSKIDAYLPVLVGVFKRNIGGTDEDSVNRDQQLSLFYSLRIPSAKAEISFEYAWDDHKWNLRDLLLSWPHSAAYIVSVKKLFQRSSGRYNDLVLEYTHMKQQLEYVVRWGGIWYQHGTTGSRYGFTNQGQVLGVGGSNGVGLNRFDLHYRLVRPRQHWLFGYHLIKNDFSIRSRPIWTEHQSSVAYTHFFGMNALRIESLSSYSKGYAFITPQKKWAAQFNVSLIHSFR